MSHVWIAQLKCPSNHAVLAVAGVYANEAAAVVATIGLRLQFEDMVEAKQIGRHCALCGSTVMHVDVNRTAFTTMEEALPALRESERQQRETAAYLRSVKN